MATHALQDPAPASVEETWGNPKNEPRLNDADYAEWRKTTERVKNVANAAGWNRADVSRRADIPAGTFTPWYEGNYNGNFGNINARVLKFLDALEETRAAATLIPAAPEFYETPTASEIRNALVFAQTGPEMAVICVGSGCGKSETAKEFQRTRPNVTLCVMRPTTCNVQAMLYDIARQLGITRFSRYLDSEIGARLKRNGRHTLLILDEAQNLKDEAVNQLRFFLDEYGCGIALMGNNELYGRFGGSTPKPAYAQLQRRVGIRLNRQVALSGDIMATIKAWNVTDPEMVKLLRVIGGKPGALGGITKTLQLAHMLAAGEEKELSAAHIKAAWQNRGGEEFH